MVQRTIEIYTSQFENVVVVVRVDDPICSKLPTNIKVVEAADADLGMAYSLRAGILSVIDSPWAIVGLADMPYIQEKTIDSIAQTLASRPQAIVRPTYQGRVGNPIGFTQSLFNEFEELNGDQGAKPLIQKHRDIVVDLEVEDLGVLKDIDQPSDLTN